MGRKRRHARKSGSGGGSLTRLRGGFRSTVHSATGTGKAKPTTPFRRSVTNLITIALRGGGRGVTAPAIRRAALDPPSYDVFASLKRPVYLPSILCGSLAPRSGGKGDTCGPQRDGHGLGISRFCSAASPASGWWAAASPARRRRPPRRRRRPPRRRRRRPRRRRSHRCASPTATGRAGPRSRSRIQKGWFKEAGVDVEFDWFEYAPSMEAFAAGKVDAVMVTVGDALVTGAPGARSVGIIVTDYSNGNDMIVARAGHQGSEGPQGQEGRPRDRPRRAPAACSRVWRRPAEGDRRQARQRADAPDGADAGVEGRRRHRRLAAERRAGAQGGRRVRRPSSPAPTCRASSTTW